MTSDEFRRVCSRFATGVAVLTVAGADGKPHGLTVNSFTSVSCDPPLVLVCVDNSCALLPLFEKATHFGLNFLEERQQAISIRFAFVPERRFDGVGWTASANRQVPWIEGALGAMECRIDQRIQAGDHQVLIAEVVGSQTAEGDPLVYFGSAYRQLKP